MFKNATIFNLSMPPGVAPVHLANAAAAAAFVPCGPTQELSVGWVPPRGEEHGAMVEVVGSAKIMRLVIETRSVPAQALGEKVDRYAANHERDTGRKPGKKEMREISEDLKRAMLPHAFPKRVAIFLWFEDSLLVVDSASYSRTDEVLMQFVKLVDGISVSMPHYGIRPTSLMASWLHDGEPKYAHFCLGRACELRATDESKAVVRYTNHELDTDEVKQHIDHGKVCTKLELNYEGNEGRVDFTLTESGALTKISVPDMAMEMGNLDVGVDQFDQDIAIMAGELKPLIADLFFALDVQEVQVTA